MQKVIELIILRQCDKKPVSTSYYFDRIFLRLGIITQMGDLIEELTNSGYIEHDGVFEGQISLYKNVRTTDKGRSYYRQEIDTVQTRELDITPERRERLEQYLFG